MKQVYIKVAGDLCTNSCCCVLGQLAAKSFGEDLETLATQKVR
jgi:hypothetical protein